MGNSSSQSQSNFIENSWNLSQLPDVKSLGSQREHSFIIPKTIPQEKVISNMDLRILLVRWKQVK